MRFLPLLILLGACGVARPQPTVPTVVDFFVDNAGKSYRLLATDELVTDNPLGQNTFSFYDSSLGAPGAVDVSSPFAILLFYPDYGTVVVLDRTLSEVSRLDLFSLEHLEQPAAIARASDNGLWVFDSWDYRLKLLDERGQPRLQSNNLRLELDLTTEPDAIYVDRQRVLLHYVADRRLGVFTNFGRFQRWINLPEATAFGWLAPLLTGTSENSYWTLDPMDKGARPQVSGKWKGKVVVGDGGVYAVEANEVVFRQQPPE